MELSGSQLKQLREALLSAFPTYQDLEMMVSSWSGKSFSVLVFNGDLEYAVFKLVERAQAQDRCEDLIRAALAHGGQNAQLISVAAQLGVSSHQPSSDLPRSTGPRIWNIPYPRNPFFTGQEALLTQLATALKAGQAAALSQPQAVTGLGGIGKTQIAIEYAYRHRREYEAVLWVLADMRESLVSGYIAIAQLLNLPQKDEQDQAVIVQAVKSWLQTHGSWLLILDNADELTVVREFMPPMFGGRILLTTRAQAMGRLASRVEVETMPIDVGALFLLRRAGLIDPDALLSNASIPDIDTAKMIWQELGGLPLALDQAGAYIEETTCSLSEYLSLYRQRRAELLKERGGIVSDHPESVASTWSLSFKKIEQKNVAAAELLRCCAYFAPDAIAEEILVAGAQHLGPLLHPVLKDRGLFNKAIAALNAYSLIRRDILKRTLSMHRLVQAVLKDAMDEQTRRQWAERVVLAVNEARPNVGDVRKWAACELWVPHALVCATWIEQEQIGSREAARLLNVAGYYLDERGRYREAEPLYVRALSIHERQLGVEHPDTASSFNNLAALYESQGKYGEAEPLYRRALWIRERQLGAEHPDTAGSLNNLAGLYRYQGKYAEAEALYECALSIYERQLGTEHPSTAGSLNNLAALYESRGKYGKAKPLYERVLAIRERQMGAEHPWTATSLHNLAGLYRSQGEYGKAEELYTRALAIRERQLGAEHPDTAGSLNNLASLYWRQGKYEEAKPLFRRALTIRERVLGPEHPDVAQSLSWLAVGYLQQQEYNKAEPLYKRAFTIYMRVLGPGHPDTQSIQEQYALLLRTMGRGEEVTALQATLP